ncbi:MAG: hypothetical protein HY043_08955 [Verrucomicrobia bacterium]|nr:hypothetical protein [Verrucomicrobiota bacterium]
MTVREKMLASSMSEDEKHSILVQLGKLESYNFGPETEKDAFECNKVQQ